MIGSIAAARRSLRAEVTAEPLLFGRMDNLFTVSGNRTRRRKDETMIGTVQATRKRRLLLATLSLMLRDRGL